MDGLLRKMTSRQMTEWMAFVTIENEESEQRNMANTAKASVDRRTAARGQ